MIILLLFAFLAGIVTILSPCILPILPIVLSTSIGNQHTSKSRPFGVVLGFILSFTFFTLFLSSIVQATGIPSDLLRQISVFIIAIFGISLLIPAFQQQLEKLFSKLARYTPQAQTKNGFWGGLVIGLSVGLLWTPCVGPILASVISLAITGQITFDSFLITLAYSLGTAIPMFLIILGGQNTLRRIPWLLSHLSTIQKIFGVVMILTALAIFFNLDRRFQTFVLSTFPQYGTGLVKFEDNPTVRQQLQQTSTNSAGLGQPTYDLIPKGTKAPDLIPGGRWFNSTQLTLAGLRGKVVIVDFWTYSCINCQRTFPYLKDWYAKYKDKGLVIIGIHSPEFEFEKDPNNVAQALKDFGITYPVVQDNNFTTWRAYDNHYWPAKYFIDKDGYIRYTHFGEGDYDQSERVIQELLAETGATDLPQTINNPQYNIYASTPETYLGYSRIANFASPEQITPDALVSYTLPKTLPNDQFAISGNWTISAESAAPSANSALEFNFNAKQVFLVMKPDNKPVRVKVLLDGQNQFPGADNIQGYVTVDSDKLYHLINLITPGRHTLRLEFAEPGVQLFAFTFG